MAAKGGEWKDKLTYYNADNRTKKVYKRDSLQNLKEDLGQDYQLFTVRLVKDPLSPLQPTTFMAYHLNVIMRTADKKWWFSLEKVGEGLVLQQSRNLDDVKYYRLGEERTFFHVRVTVTSFDLTSKRLFDVIDWLQRNNSLTDQYHFLFKNCKHFAKKAYDEIAENDTATIFDGIGVLTRLPLIGNLDSIAFEREGY